MNKQLYIQVDIKSLAALRKTYCEFPYQIMPHIHRVQCISDKQCHDIDLECLWKKVFLPVFFYFLCLNNGFILFPTFSAPSSYIYTVVVLCFHHFISPHFWFQFWFLQATSKAKNMLHYLNQIICFGAKE